MTPGKTQLKTKTLGIALALALCATGGISVSAHADKGGHHDNKSNKGHDDNSGRSTGKGSSHEHTVVIINDKDRQAIRKYIKSRHHKKCPPGLAKKNNDCQPPGQVKKYEIGKTLPSDIKYVSVPYSLRRNLQALQPGYQYVRVDNDVLLMSKSDRIVTDAITLLNTLAE